MADCTERVLRGDHGVVFPAGCFRWHELFGFPRHHAVAYPLV